MTISRISLVGEDRGILEISNKKKRISALGKSVVTPPPAWRRNKGVQCFLWRNGTPPPHGGTRDEMLGESEKQSCFLENRPTREETRIIAGAEKWTMLPVIQRPPGDFWKSIFTV